LSTTTDITEENQMSTTTEPVLDVQSLKKTYQTRQGGVDAIADLTFAVKPGETSVFTLRGVAPGDYAFLAEAFDRLDLVRQRDDAVVELAQLRLSLGDHEAATALLQERDFQPWEGGEGQALRAWDRACLAPR
jgi:hypothetical protein